MFENKRKIITIGVLVAIFVAILFYIIWGIILNKGTVVFKSDPDFRISIGNNRELCEASQCEFLIPVGEHEYIIMKPGYYDHRGFVEIRRGGTHIIEPNLYFIPKVLDPEKYNMFELPVGYGKYTDRLKDITLFHNIEESKRLGRLPKIIENIRFSHSGDYALVFQSGAISIYDTRDFTMQEIPLKSDVTDAGWASDEKIIYTVKYVQEANKDALVKINMESLAIQNLLYFPRDIEKYNLSVSPNEEYVALIDKTSRLERLYILSLDQETRTNVFEGYIIERGKWSQDGELYVFSAKSVEENENLSAMWVVETHTKNIQKLSFKTDINNTDFSGEDFYFVTDQPYSVKTSDVPYVSTFTEREFQIPEVSEILLEQTVPLDISLHKLTFDDDKTYFLKNLSEEISVLPEKIEITPNGKIIRLFIKDEYYDIRIAE